MVECNAFDPIFLFIVIAFNMTKVFIIFTK